MSWSLHHGDALVVLPTIPCATIDAVITDPPYNSGGRTMTERTLSSARCKYVSSDAHHDLHDFTGDNRDQRSYMEWLSLVLAHSLRAAVLGAPLLVFTDWRQLPATSDALQVAGWTWRGIIPWYKPNSRPQRAGFRRACEYVLWGTNGPVDGPANPVYLPGLVSASQPAGATRVHITQKPDSVMRELVRICKPAGTILDPFTGSGATGVAALAEGRSFVGIELSDHYYGVASRRLTLTSA